MREAGPAAGQDRFVLLDICPRTIAAKGLGGGGRLRKCGPPPPCPGRRVSVLANWVVLPSSIDNLAVSAQGFRRGANRVRKVCTAVQSAYAASFILLLRCAEHVVEGHEDACVSSHLRDYSPHCHH